MDSLSLLSLVWLSVAQYHVGNSCADVETSAAPDVAYQGGVTTDGWVVPPANVDSGIPAEKLGDVGIDFELPLRDYAPNTRSDINLSEAEIEVDRFQVSPNGDIRSQKGIFSTQQPGCE